MHARRELIKILLGKFLYIELNLIKKIKKMKSSSSHSSSQPNEKSKLNLQHFIDRGGDAGWTFAKGKEM